MNAWNPYNCIVVFLSSECRENEQLSKYGDTKTARSIMLVELKKLIEANPLFRDKLAFPTLKSSRLRTLINQRWSWYHTCYYKIREANIICYTSIYRYIYIFLIWKYGFIQLELAASAMQESKAKPRHQDFIHRSHMFASKRSSCTYTCQSSSCCSCKTCCLYTTWTF